MSTFASLFYDGIIPASPTQTDTQRIFPCNVTISDDVITVDYFSTYDKNVKLGSRSMKINEAKLGEKKTVSITIMVATLNAPTVVIKNDSSAFTLVHFGDFPGKKLMGKKAQTADLDEITTAIFNTNNTEPATSKPEPEWFQVDKEAQTSSKSSLKINIGMKKILAYIVAAIIAGVILGIALGSAIKGDRTSDIYDDNGNGRYDSEDVFGDNAEGWLEYAESFD